MRIRLRACRYYKAIALAKEGYAREHIDPNTQKKIERPIKHTKLVTDDAV